MSSATSTPPSTRSARCSATRPRARASSKRCPGADIGSSARSNRRRSAQAPVEPIADRTLVGVWRKIAAGVLALLVLVLGAIVAYRWHRQQRPQEQEALTAVPFTALPGQETAPAFSPDGSRIAFAWNGDPETRDQRLRPVRKGHRERNLLRLTQHPSEWISPAWYPDGADRVNGGRRL